MTTQPHPALAIAAEIYLRGRITEQEWGMPRTYDMAAMGHAVFADRVLLGLWLESSMMLLSAEVLHMEQWEGTVYGPPAAASRRADHAASKLLLDWLRQQPR